MSLEKCSVVVPKKKLMLQKPEATLKSPATEVNPHCILEIIIVDIEVEEHVITEIETESTIWTTLQEPAVDNNSTVKEEDIVATAFVLLSGEHEERLSHSEQAFSDQA